MKYDFENDWEEHVKSELLLIGFHYNHNKDITENSLNYFNMLRRTPSQTPRKVMFSKEFRCPDENKNGLNGLVKKIEDGVSLIPNLSKTIAKPNYSDATLDDWGVHHFHLGEREINGVVERTGNVAFVFILADYALFLQVLPHGKGQSNVWVNTTLIESIHNNWPEVICHLKTELSGTALTPKERLTLRKNNTNVDIKVSDGTVYFSPGGGLMSNGTAMNDFTRLQKLYRDIEYFDKVVALESEQIKMKISSPTGQLNLKLDFSEPEKIRVIEINSKTILNF
ncbi:MAG TPA: hypothetical protein DEO86_02990 [Colwellia sp.]|nr:hypothetical protein [Colwellia sp.]